MEVGGLLQFLSRSYDYKQMSLLDNLGVLFSHLVAALLSPVSQKSKGIKIGESTTVLGIPLDRLVTAYGRVRYNRLT